MTEKVPPLLKTKRFFLAHPKGLDDAELERLQARAALALTELAAGRANVVVTLGKDDFDARWSQLGSWEAWAREVVQGRLSYTSDEPRYHAIVLISPQLGNATRMIVQNALAAGRPVLLLRETGELVVISTVFTLDTNNWKGGWWAR